MEQSLQMIVLFPRRWNKTAWHFWIFLFLMLGGCYQAPFSRDEIDWAHGTTARKDLFRHPHSMEGQSVILGGRIINIEREGLVSRIYVRAYPLDTSFHPETNKPALGNVLVKTDEPLSPERFHAGNKIEVIGTVARPSHEKTAAQGIISIPVVQARSLHASAPPSPPGMMWSFGTFGFF